MAPPKAKNPHEACALYAHKLQKRFPFNDIRGYDFEELTDYRTYGKTLREDNKPNVRQYANAYGLFYLHSTVKQPDGSSAYIFVHCIKELSDIKFRGLMFTNYSEAYRYANAHGCHIIRKPTFSMDILDFLQADTDDIDLFVDRVDFGFGARLRAQHTSVSRIKMKI